MSEKATVVTSETFLQNLTGSTAAPEVKPDDAGTTIPEAESTDQSGEQKPERPKKPSLIEEVVRLRHERNNERDSNAALRSELAELREQMQAAQAQPAPKELDPKPERTQFVSDGDFMEALADWTADRKIAERQQEEQQARIQAAQQQLADNFEKRRTAVLDELKDYEEVVSKSEIDLPNPIYMAIVESDYGPEIAYYLAKNPDEAKLLRGMSLTSAIRMLGKLEDRLAEEKKPPETKKDEKPAAGTAAPEKSKAPAPIEPLSDASGSAEKPTSQMTYAEYKAMRQQQEAARRKR